MVGERNSDCHSQNYRRSCRETARLDTFKSSSTTANTGVPLPNPSSEQTLSPRRTFRVRCFENTDRWFTRVGRLLAAVHEGFWLGCLSADDLNAITSSHFDASQLYKSTAHNLSGFMSWEASLVERYFQPGSRVLVAAAGAGREILALRKAGHEAEGFECSLPLVRAGKEIFDRLGERYSVVASAPDSVPSGPADYDALVLGWSAYTHIPTKVRRVAFLEALKCRSVPGSPLMLSFFTRRGRSSSDRTVDGTAAAARFLFRGRKDRFEPGDRLEWSRYVHRFTQRELEAELEDGGFSPAY
jgi:hypothetical protein